MNPTQRIVEMRFRAEDVRRRKERERKETKR